MAVTGDGSDHTKPKQHLDSPQEVALAGILRADSHGEIPKIAEASPSHPFGGLDASHDRFQARLKDTVAREMFLDYFRDAAATEQEKAMLALLMNPTKPSDRIT